MARPEWGVCRIVPAVDRFLQKISVSLRRAEIRAQKS